MRGRSPEQPDQTDEIPVVVPTRAEATRAEPGVDARPARAPEPRGGFRPRRIRPLNIAAFASLIAGLSSGVLTWRSAATTPLLFEQLAFTVSGGMLSVALLALGGILAVADVTIRHSEQRRDRHGRLLASVETLRARLLRG